jgi:RNA polymerase sigma-70 factor (ECF subfamily)
MTVPGPDPLLLGLAAGDERAYALLYERFGTRLYRTAAGMLGNRADADDVVQEVFAALVRSRERLAHVEDLTAYLFTILRHAVGQCAARRRKEVQARQSAAESAMHARCAPGETKGNDFQETLRQALIMLPPEQREAVSLKIAGELTFAQIAEVLKINPNTAASRYRYALEKLRLLLKENYG